MQMFFFSVILWTSIWILPRYVTQRRFVFLARRRFSLMSISRNFFFWITDWQAKYHTTSSARNERLSRDNRRYKGQQKFEDFKSLLFLKLISALILDKRPRTRTQRGISFAIVVVGFYRWKLMTMTMQHGTVTNWKFSGLINRRIIRSSQIVLQHHNNSSARAFLNFVHFLAVLCKKNNVKLQICAV